MKKYISLISIFVLILVGCEKTDTVEINLPNQEYIVIQAKLIADEDFQGLRITRTLPVNETYDIKKAEIKNAFVYLRRNDVQIIPLHYTLNGIYVTTSALPIVSGDKYELIGEANGHKFYSKTFIPQVPVVTNFDYNANQYYMEANVKSHPNEVYGSLWVIDGNLNRAADDFYSVINTNTGDTLTNPLSTTRTQELPEIYRSFSYNNRRSVLVYSFDKQFEPFFNSKNNNQPVESYFQEGGGTISWNVQGDGVIGLFIGMANSSL